MIPLSSDSTKREKQLRNLADKVGVGAPRCDTLARLTPVIGEEATRTHTGEPFVSNISRSVARFD
jgi:hypothetical protein